MLQIVLIRPGSTHYDQQQRVQGNLDMPLSPDGTAEVMNLVEPLREQGLQVMYAAGSQPALQTGELLADALELRLRKLDHLENINLGLWQGMQIAEVRHKQPRVYRQWQEQPETVCPPEGEMLGEADDRVRTAVTRLLRRHKEGTIGLVLPEPLLSLARRLLVQEELGDLWQPSEGRGGWKRLAVDPETLFAGTR